MYSRGHLCSLIRVIASARRTTRVLVVGHRAVAGPTVRGEAQPEDALLGGLDEVGTGRRHRPVGTVTL